MLQGADGCRKEAACSLEGAAALAWLDASAGALHGQGQGHQVAQHARLCLGVPQSCTAAMDQLRLSGPALAHLACHQTVAALPSATVDSNLDSIQLHQLAHHECIMGEACSTKRGQNAKSVPVFGGR